MHVTSFSSISYHRNNEIALIIPDQDHILIHTKQRAGIRHAGLCSQLLRYMQGPKFIFFLESLLSTSKQNIPVKFRVFNLKKIAFGLKFKSMKNYVFHKLYFCINPIHNMDRRGKAHIVMEIQVGGAKEGQLFGLKV